MIDNDHIEIRFHSPDEPLIGPRGVEAGELAFPGGHFANEIEHEGGHWRFHHTEGMTDSSGRRWNRLVNTEDRTEP